MPNEGYPKANEGERHESGEKEPKGDKAADRSGEKGGRIKNGVAMGKADATGDNKLFDTGRTAGTCYSHDRKSHQ